MSKRTFLKMMNGLCAMRLAVIMAVSAPVLFAPLTARADDAAALATKITGFSHGGSGTLTATVDANTVTVTGTVTGAASALNLSINSGVTVKWEADYAGSTTGTAALIEPGGGGEFEVVAGGFVQNSGGGYALYSKNAINDANLKITVSGGEVSAVGSGMAIYTGGANAVVTVSGGKVHAEAGRAVFMAGANSVVTVSDGEVSATTGHAITANGSAVVSGGAVSATIGYAIYTSGETATVTVSGGEVSNVATSSANSVIYMSNNNNTGLNVTVSGTGKVIAKAAGGFAIYTFGNVEVSDGKVTATTGNAIYASGASSTVTLSDGFVFAYGSTIIGTNNVIYILSGSSPVISGNGVAVAWANPGGAPAYTEGATTNLTVLSSDASATWHNNSGTGGISYLNNTNSGFFAIDGVTVNALISTITITTQPAVTTSVPAGNISGSLTVAATVSPGGTPTYQWYSNTTNSQAGGASISGETNASFTIPTTLAAGIYYYYCIVSATNATSIMSDVATVMVSAQPDPATYGVNIGTFANGSVSADKTAAATGETVTLTVYPSSGYELASISATGVTLSGNGNTRTFTMPAQAVTVTATFQKTAARQAVEDAQYLIENTGFAVAQATANSSSDVRQWLVDYINSLISGTGVSISLSDVSINSFSAATEGNASNYSGTNGGFNFTVALSKNGASLTTASKTGTVTATPYTPPATYAITIASTTNGTVTANSTRTTAGATITVTIAPASGYELDAVSAYRTGSAGTTVALTGSGNTRTFIMPAYGVTVTATFRKTQAQSDREAVEAAKTAIEGGTYRVAQATANDAASVRTWLVNTLNTLFGQSHDMQLRSATSIDGNVTVTAVTPATAGTESNPSGVNGAFTFTVTLNRGASNATATFTGGVIIATPYSVTPTGIESPQFAKLYAVSAGGGLQVHGLVPGEVLSIYNMSGQLQFKGKATAPEQLVLLRERGIYIVVSGKQRVKAVY